MRASRLPTLFLALLFGLLPSPAVSLPHGQANPPQTLSGTVVDASGLAAPGAVVSLNSTAGERQTVTDTAGRFVFDNVPAGDASIGVTLQGFAPATIQVTGSTTNLNVVLQPVGVSEEVTVHGSALIVGETNTGTRTPTPLRDVPQAVTVVTSTLIAEQRMQSMADVVRYVPGVGIAQGEGNRDTPIFRGNSSTSDFFVDGIRDDVQYFRDLYNVDRVEAFRGANAMIFGRGGVGGVINRVGKQAEWMPSRQADLQLGSFDNRRFTADLGQPVNDTVAVRLNGMYENSDSYRESFGLERYGVNPTIAFALSPDTTLRASYEHFHDERTADRGIPSFEGSPLPTDPGTFFGNPDISTSDATVNLFSALIEHRFDSQLNLRSRLLYGDYNKFYQNVFPGAVNELGTEVSISGYNNRGDRTNLFSQTDLVASARTGGIDHTLLAGAELARQETDNLRLTAYFTTISPTTTSVNVPVTSPTTSLPVEFSPSATDNDNHGVATLGAVYVQDQVTFSEHVQAVVGLRYDYFSVDFTNNRLATDLGSTDNLLSPRLALIYKPSTPVSLYGTYSLSYLPRAGEQLSSLSLTNEALDPEEFQNYEVGAKWDIVPSLQFTAAIYRLDRGNVIVTDPLNPAVSELVDAQRTEGLELSLAGNINPKWSVAGAYAYQDGEITRSLSATAQAGARLAQLPEHSFSLWNKYDFTSMFGAGLGIIYRDDIFTSTDNTVLLPSFTRLDAAVFFNTSSRIRLQLNVQNLLDEEYYLFAHSNNNITPGSPRAALVSMTTRF